MAKEYYTVTNVLPAGWKLGDGTILTEATEFSEEEFTKVRPFIPDNSSVYRILESINTPEIKQGA